MDEVRLKKRQRSALSAEQKVAFVLLMVLGFGGVILGFISFGANIQRPFDQQAASYTGEQILPTDQREAAEIAAQKSRDSDGDGINDYDELAVFKTSPFLADTDSDGFDDRTEIFSGNDPNCPRGKDCASFVTNDEAGSGARPEDVFSGPSGGRFENLDLNSPADIQAYLQNLSLEEVRAQLIQQGVPKETLDQFDDATLTQMIQTAISEAEAGGEFDQILEQGNSIQF